MAWTKQSMVMVKEYDVWSTCDSIAYTQLLHSKVYLRLIALQDVCLSGGSKTTSSTLQEGRWEAADGEPLGSDSAGGDVAWGEYTGFAKLNALSVATENREIRYLSCANPPR